MKFSYMLSYKKGGRATDQEHPILCKPVHGLQYEASLKFYGEKEKGGEKNCLGLRYDHLDTPRQNRGCWLQREGGR